jgi:hypothetical protein
MRYIYTLSDPKTLDIRYVGQTNDINRRFNDHISSSINENSESYNTYKSNWIRKIIKSGSKPIIYIIDECVTLDESNYLEKYYIEKYTNDGYRLTNSYVSDVTEFSIETRKKMSKAKLGKSLEEIVGEEKAIELKRKYSDKMKLNNINKSNDPLVKKKISDTLKQYFSNPENHWAYGKKMSDEHNEKLRLAKINNPKNVGNRKPCTEEIKDKIRSKILGSKVNRYKILQYDLEMSFLKEWNSLREIERVDPTLKRDQISKCCKGLKDYYAGYIWIYKNEN